MASFTSPALSGDTLFVGANSGSFYALDAGTGQPLWQHDIGTWVPAGPAVSGNTVVAGALDGNLYAFTPGGQAAQRWPLGFRHGHQQDHRRGRCPHRARSSR